ncbi:MAG: adenosylmethionine decarboxylase [Pseudonocardiales bacterium]|nr:adenosylmethionine decarboxylase [Pseudonocardiales bacterium]
MTEASQQPRGRHVFAELRGISPAVLDDAPKLSEALRSALVTAGAQVRQVVSEAFTPHGVTVVAVLAESHASVHTWPEHGQAFADVFTCGDSADPVAAVRLLGDALGAADTTLRVVDRGAGSPDSSPTLSEPLSAGLRRLWELGEVRWQGDTGFQRVLIADTSHGVTLFCDDERQSAESSQLVYHEALFVPAALLAERLDSVLVIGSSEGVVSQLAVSAGAAVVDHVDIDAECVRACARHLPYGYRVEELAAAERGDGPVRMHYADGAAFVEHADRRRDVIVVDLPDERPDDAGAQHNRLYGTEFLRRCAELLTPGGVLVSQAGCPTLWRNETLRTAWRRFGAVFDTVAYHGSDEHEWAFLLGGREPVADPTALMVDRLRSLPYRPVSIDAARLQAGSMPPRSVRESSIR